jgi:hypothetical protein
MYSTMKITCRMGTLEATAVIDELYKSSLLSQENANINYDAHSQEYKVHKIKFVEVKISWSVIC